MLYLDTSALLKLHIREPDSGVVNSLVTSQDLPLPVWEIQEAEFTNALLLEVSWQEIPLDAAISQLALFQDRRRRGLYHFPEINRSSLMKNFLKLSAETPRLGCRTLDILHVACAIEIGATAFLSFDHRQNTLANHAGLTLATK